MNNNSNYNSYRRGYKIRPAVQNLLETTGIDLTNGAGIPELDRFQEYFSEYKIVVYRGLNCDSIMFEGRVESPKRLNLLYDDVHKHYHVIASLTGAMARRYVCRVCNKGFRRDVTHYATRRAATACPAPRARSRAFESPATCATDTLGVGRVSTIIGKERGATRRVSASESDVAPRAARS